MADAMAGAKDIIAERISDRADYRTYIRNATMEQGMIRSQAKDEKQSLFTRCTTSTRSR